MPCRPRPGWETAIWLTAVAGLQLAYVVAGSGLELAVAPDVVEHLAIANAWIHGQGFVDPVQYYYFLPETAPQPAIAIRAPLVSIALAGPLAVGASVQTAFAAHAALSVVMSAVGFAVFRRSMSAPAAGVAALAATTTLPWTLVSVRPLTEPVSWFFALLVLASAPRALASRSGACLCAALTVAAWLGRNTMIALVPVVVAAPVHTRGWRAAVRSGPLRAYVLAFLALWLATRFGVQLLTGVQPYAGYGVVWHHFEVGSLGRYDVDYGSAVGFAVDHAGQIARSWLRHAWLLARVTLTSGLYGYLGWLAAIGLAWAAWRRRRLGFDHAMLAWATLALAAPVIVAYTTFESVRYPLHVVLAGSALGVAAIDSLLRERGPSLRPAVAGAIVITGLVALVALRIALLPAGTGSVTARDAKLAARFAALCPRLEPDVRVASTKPWPLHWYCGNASLLLPIDHAEPGVLERFVAERRPDYLIGVAPERARAAGLASLGRVGGQPLHAAPAPGGAVWRAPPALVCREREHLCAAVDGRLRLAPSGAAPSRERRPGADDAGTGPDRVRGSAE